MPMYKFALVMVSVVCACFGQRHPLKAVAQLLAHCSSDGLQPTAHQGSTVGMNERTSALRSWGREMGSLWLFRKDLAKEQLDGQGRSTEVCNTVLSANSLDQLLKRTRPKPTSRQYNMPLHLLLLQFTMPLTPGGERQAEVRVSGTSRHIAAHAIHKQMYNHGNLHWMVPKVERGTRLAMKAKTALVENPNQRALAITLALSVTWTLAQLVGANLAHSSSLMSDAMAMSVDCAAYAFNLVSESRPKRDRVIRFAAPLVSAVILLGVTALSLGDALVALQGSEEAINEEVDGVLVLGFGTAMLLVDLAMLGAIFFRGKAADGSPAQWCGVSPRTELNLFSGMSHALADLLRSITQVVVGLLILAGGPSEIVDAYGTVVISSTILLGAVFLLYEVALQWRELPASKM